MSRPRVSRRTSRLPVVGLALVALHGLACGGADEPPEAVPFRVPPGFTAERVAGPDLVSYPMFAAQDEQGRLYVSESTEPNVMTTEEMAERPSYRVRLLEDRDRDGIFDHSRVFADGIAFPQGGVFAEGALYVSAAPDLLRLADTDGDGVADEREVLLTGWTLSVNGALLHGPFRGPDGWLYLTDARRSYRIETREGAVLEGKGGRVWRCRLDGSDLEVVAAGGFDNPVEVAFTPAGETLGTMTYFVDPRAGQRDALMHWVEGGVYPKPHPVIEEDRLLRTGDLMPVMTKLANVAPSGLVRYRSGAFGPGYAGNLFSAQFNTHRVMRHRLSRDGATFATSDEEFAVSDDPNFHPTDVLEDADGSLLLLDTGGWFLKGCPLSRVARPEYRGGLYRIRRVGAPPVADPRGEALRLDSLSPRALVALLRDERPAVRDAAAQRLVSAGDAAVEPLVEWLAGSHPAEARSAAVFALYRIGSAAALAAVRIALADADTDVRVAAARAAGLARDPAAVPRLLERLRDDEPASRRQAATALGRIGDRSAVPALLSALALPGDRFVEHASIFALLRLADPGPVAARLADPSPRVRKGALIALDQMPGAPLGQAQLVASLGSEDPELRRAALWIASRRPEWSAEIAAYLEARLRSRGARAASDSESLNEALLRLCPSSEVQAAVARLLESPETPSGRQEPLLEILASCPVSDFPSLWLRPLRRRLGDPEVGVRSMAVDVVRARELAGFDAELQALAAEADEEPRIRVAALDALVRTRPGLTGEAFRFLVDRLASSSDASVRQLAAAVLGRAGLSDPQRLEIAERGLTRDNLLLLPALLEAFRGGESESVGEALVASLEALAPALDGLAVEGLAELLSSYPASVRGAAGDLQARLTGLKAERLERLEGLLAELAALGPGEPGRGRGLFFGSTLGCSSCHSVGSEGGSVGPDLTAIGAIRSRHDLLEAIVFPSASFVRQYESVRVRTSSGVHSGIIGSQSPDAIVLVTGADYRVRIPRGDVVSVEPSPVSMMPEGLHEALSVPELSDLMAFLETLGEATQPARP